MTVEFLHQERGLPLEISHLIDDYVFYSTEYDILIGHLWEELPLKEYIDPQRIHLGISRMLYDEFGHSFHQMSERFPRIDSGDDYSRHIWVLANSILLDYLSLQSIYPRYTRISGDIDEICQRKAVRDKIIPSTTSLQNYFRDETWRKTATAKSQLTEFDGLTHIPKLSACNAALEESSIFSIKAYLQRHGQHTDGDRIELINRARLVK